MTCVEILIFNKITNNKITNRDLRHCLSELKRLTEVVIEKSHLLWCETALGGNVACGGETCREFGVGADPLVEFLEGGGVVDVGTIRHGEFFFC